MHEHGFDFSYNDLCEYNKSKMPADGTELSNEFLDQVTGGWSARVVLGGLLDPSSPCTCVVGDGGDEAADKDAKKYRFKCACPVLGGGNT